jgi:hypothetical protein
LVVFCVLNLLTFAPVDWLAWYLYPRIRNGINTHLFSTFFFPCSSDKSWHTKVHKPKISYQAYSLLYLCLKNAEWDWFLQHSTCFTPFIWTFYPRDDTNSTILALTLRQLLNPFISLYHSIFFQIICSIRYKKAI